MTAPAATLLARPSIRATMEAAFDAGIYELWSFFTACRDAWDRETPTFNRKLEDVEMPADVGERTAVEGRLYATLGHAPRGTWVFAKEPKLLGGEWFHFYAALMSDGYGGVVEIADDWGKESTFEDLRELMVQREVFAAHRAVEAEREQRGLPPNTPTVWPEDHYHEGRLVPF